MLPKVDEVREDLLHVEEKRMKKKKSAELLWSLKKQFKISLLKND